jgi:peptidoglycan/xylan/chitin deacetylase (PgdA/CDA1 family)
MKRTFKRTVLDVLANPWVGRFLAFTGQPRCAVLMMHRFQTPDGSHVGHDPKKLRTILEGLRKSKVGLVDVEQAIYSMDPDSTGTSSTRLSVAFTVDDGYADAVDIAAPIFAEFDCPVTMFVVPDAVEQRSWFWWDRIDYVLRHSKSKKLKVDLQQFRSNIEWTDQPSRLAVQRNIGEQLTQVNTSIVQQFIDVLSEKADVPVPQLAPPEYRVLSWSEMQSAERTGMRFGAHTMSHPILSRCSDAQAQSEIVESVRVVRENISNPSSVFCYPSGKRGDFGVREARAVASAGLTAAVTSEHALIRRTKHEPGDTSWRFTIPRFAYDERTGGIPRLFVGFGT